MASHDEESLRPHPEELSRRISEIDLTNLRRRADTETVPPRYSHAELLKLRSTENYGVGITSPEIAEGMTTPHDFPAPPPPTPAHPATSDSDALDGDDGVSRAVQAPANGGGKQKKKKKSSGKNKKVAPTGFEEFYADPPLTPDEYDEECDLYASARPFHLRIETCIQRYRMKRNLDSVRANILTKYLMLGGVESSTTKPFGALDRETLENSTTDKIAAIQATDHIRAGGKNAKYYDPTDSDKWVVDFEGVAKGFLSHTAPRRFSLHSEAEVKQICAVIRNFLNYILAHAVCPEYAADIVAARKVCDLADKELWSLKQLQTLLPGDFNIAASTLHGGHYHGIRFRAESWAANDPSDDFLNVTPEMADLDAQIVFKAGIAFAGSDELFVEFLNKDVAIIKSETKCYEVIKIDRASIHTIEEYKKIRGPQYRPVKALGGVHFKSWEGPGLDEEDTTDDEDESLLPTTIETFWIEDNILQYFIVGMKFELAVHELNIGLKFFDRVLGQYCSFHTALPNEKVIEYWKEPTMNNRPPPTEDDPEAEETAVALDEGKDLEDFDKDFGEKKIQVKVTEPKSKED